VLLFLYQALNTGTRVRKKSSSIVIIILLITESSRLLGRRLNAYVDQVV